MNYPFDPSTRQLVFDHLWQSLPAYYRVKDTTIQGQGDLRRLLWLLSAALAASRQNIEELHADLFIDSANDWVIPYLAKTVGTTLVFPDAVSNRIDVRNTIGWRKRKGTVPTLSDLGSELTRQLVVTQEGWQQVQLSQDLNMLRPERVVPNLRPAVLAETVHGPLNTAAHTIDLRAISLSTGKYHPAAVYHWLHPTTMFEVSLGEPARLPDPPVAIDCRFAFSPLGEYQPLRARRTSRDDVLKTDYIPELHFASRPQDWFGRPGRFAIYDDGIMAGMTLLSGDARLASRIPAVTDLVQREVRIQLLQFDAQSMPGPVMVQVGAVPIVLGEPDVAALQLCAQLQIDADGASHLTTLNNGPIDAASLLVIRLIPVDAGARNFGGAIIEVSSDAITSSLAHPTGELAQEGFLRGSLLIELPATRVLGERLFYVAGDGSLYDSQIDGAGPAVNVPFEDAWLSTTGPGASWPGSPAQNDLAFFRGLPITYARVAHGGRVLSGQQTVAATQGCALVFAAGYFTTHPQYEPYLRLSWLGADSSAASIDVLDSDGTVSADAPARLHEIGKLAQLDPNQFRLAARFECGTDQTTLSPLELVIRSFDGRSLLVYLPELKSTAGSTESTWPISDEQIAASTAITVSADGSTWWDRTTINARMALGQVMPLREHRSLRRRRVTYRRLCPWKNETAALSHAPTRPGTLDVDPASGLFAMALSEPPTHVTVQYQEGFTAHTGARPALREPVLDAQLLPPTRLVSKHGTLHAHAPAEWLTLPMHRSLTEALLDIQANGSDVEVVQFEDSAIYHDEDIVWPTSCRHLTIQAAEMQRPVVLVRSFTTDAVLEYDSMQWLGLTLTSGAPIQFHLPKTARFSIRYCSIMQPSFALVMPAVPHAIKGSVEIDHSAIGQLTLEGGGRLRIQDSIVDAGAGLATMAIEAIDGLVHIERSTVFGFVKSLVLEASEVIFNDDVTVADRFRGCVRYSRATVNSILPRQHRTVIGTRATFVSVDRHNAAYARLAESCDREITRGAEDGSEMGAFKDLQQAQRYDAYYRRLVEYTPAGLQSGQIRVD